MASGSKPPYTNYQGPGSPKNEELNFKSENLRNLGFGAPSDSPSKTPENLPIGSAPDGVEYEDDKGFSDFPPDY